MPELLQGSPPSVRDALHSGPPTNSQQGSQRSQGGQKETGSFTSQRGEKVKQEVEGGDGSHSRCVSRGEKVEAEGEDRSEKLRVPGRCSRKKCETS